MPEKRIKKQRLDRVRMLYVFKLRFKRRIKLKICCVVFIKLLNKFDKIEQLKEIERKFKVNVTQMSFIEELIPKNIIQGYIHSSSSISTRIRIVDDLAFLTIKGGLSALERDEFEYEIPLSEANEMMTLFCFKLLKKKRYLFYQNDLCWEIDVFEGNLQGLIIAEIELKDVNTSINLPGWIAEEVTEDPSYLNINLILRA